MPDRKIRWHIAPPPEVTTEYAGTRLGEYYTRAEAKLYTQQRASERLQAEYGLEPIGVSADGPCYLGVAAFGAEIVYPEDDAPMVANTVVKRPEDVYQLRFPTSYVETPAMRPFVEMARWMSQETGRKVHFGSGLEGPVTTAELLRGQEFFLDLYEHPREAHRLLEIATESIIRFPRECRHYQGLPPPKGGGIADDFAGLISPEMWPEFVMPYYRRIYEALGDGPRSMHSELLHPGHLPFLLDLGITNFDPGNDQYLTVEDLVACDGLNFTWNLFTVRDMQRGTPESIRSLYVSCVERGATAVVTELCRGTPPENVRAFIEVARKCE